MKEPPASLGQLLCQQWWKLEEEKGTEARITREHVVGLLELTQEASLLGEVFLTSHDTEPFDSGAAMNLVSALGELAEEEADQRLWELAARIAEAALAIAQDEHLSRWLGDFQTQRDIQDVDDSAALLREADRSRRDTDPRRTRKFYEAAVERAEEGEDADLFVNALSRLILYLCETGERTAAADYLTVYPDHDLELMEALGRRVLDQAHDEGNTTASWLAVGSLGRTLERAGRVEEALPLWQEALAAGSDDPVTADRLSLYLERQRRHGEAISVIEAALPRLEALGWVDLRAVDVLRRRLLRCRDRLLGRPRRAAPGVFVRAGEGFLEPDFRAAGGKGISSLALGPDAAYCAAHRQGEALLLDVDLVSGLVLREANALPPVPDGAILRAETGHAFAIGGRHSGAAWTSGPDGSNLTRLSFPNRITQAVWIGDVWVVSSDRGGIFGVVPGSGIAWADDSYSPYRLTACGGLAVATTFGQVVAYSPVDLHGLSYFEGVPTGQVVAYSPGGEVVWEASLDGVVWHLRAGRDLLVAGDNHGRLHFLDGSGALLGSQEIADSGRDVALAVDGESTVAWNGSRLFFFSRQGLEESPEVTLDYEYPGAGVDGVAAWGRFALLWSRRRMYIASRRGKVLWMGDFPKRRIFAVAAQGPRIFVAGEALWALRAGADGA
jgi:tetratricopeptide (TPR) repeat protein